MRTCALQDRAAGVSLRARALTGAALSVHFREVETLLEREPDYVLILPWNLQGEVVEQQREYAQRGGRFIVPLPEPRILPSECA